MTRTNENGTRLEAKAAWSVVVVYEDAAARERAVGFCDQLVERFWAQFEFDVSWWSFALLEEPAQPRKRQKRPRCADLIVFAANPEGDFPCRSRAWVETWLNQRGDREGMLVACWNRRGAPAAGKDRSIITSATPPIMGRWIT